MVPVIIYVESLPSLKEAMADLKSIEPLFSNFSPKVLVLEFDWQAVKAMTSVKANILFMFDKMILQI